MEMKKKLAQKMTELFYGKRKLMDTTLVPMFEDMTNTSEN